MPRMALVVKLFVLGILVTAYVFEYFTQLKMQEAIDSQRETIQILQRQRIALYRCVQPTKEELN